MTSIRRYFVGLPKLAALLCLFSITAVNSAEMTEPQVLVQESSEEMIAALEENREAIENDPQTIYKLVQDILLVNFDFRKMSQLALGKNWRKITEDQKNRFTDEFRLLLVRTYSTAMIEYSGQEINYLPFKGDLAKKKANVNMEILQAGGPAIPMRVSLYMNGEAWKVYDLKIDGISLVTNYRTTFTDAIRKDGMEGLISSLAKRNAKVKA